MRILTTINPRNVLIRTGAGTSHHAWPIQTVHRPSSWAWEYLRHKRYQGYIHQINIYSHTHIYIFKYLCSYLQSYRATYIYIMQFLCVYIVYCFCMSVHAQACKMQSDCGGLLLYSKWRKKNCSPIDINIDTYLNVEGSERLDHGTYKNRW